MQGGEQQRQRGLRDAGTRRQRLRELGEALVLDDASNERELQEAHANGRPIVVRAASPEAVRAALAHPEVAAALVPVERRELLDLDLRELTYGP